MLQRTRATAIRQGNDLPMRLVIDTNVIVSALLHPGRTPDRALSSALASGCVVLLDARIEAEYHEVVARRKFAAVPAERREGLLRALLHAAEAVVAAPSSHVLADPDDLPFVEVACSGRADALVTGNTRHFPANLGVRVITPAELAEVLQGGCPVPR